MAKRVFDCNMRLATCKCSNEIKRTIPGLAMTPAEVSEMAARGVPISSQIAAVYDENQSPTNFEVEPMLKRGADINQLWELEQSSRDKLLSARRKDIQNYGK